MIYQLRRLDNEISSSGYNCGDIEFDCLRQADGTEVSWFWILWEDYHS